LLLVPFKALWTGRCAAVCRRWRAVAESEPVKRRKRNGKWEAYANGWIEPRKLTGHGGNVVSPAVGRDGTIFSGSSRAVRVWNWGNEIRTLKGHTNWVRCLAVGPDGTVYSGSFDRTVRVWSGEDGALIRTLIGHNDAVLAVAVGSNDKIYSGSEDSTIRVWSTQDGAHIQTLEGHTNRVIALLLGLDGRVYSASHDSTIRVWSGDDGAHIQTLEEHTDSVTAMAWGPDGKLYSGSYDCTIRVWYDDGAAIFKTAESTICSLVWMDGNLFAGLAKGILVWSSDQLGPTDPPSHVLDGAVCGDRFLVGGPSGELYAAGAFSRDTIFKFV
jgi:WD40 repeat protein